MGEHYKILQIVDSLDIGGAERMSANIYNTLTASNIQNWLVVSRNSGPIYNFIEDKKNVFFLNKKSFFDCFAFYKLFKLIKSSKPSIIHAHQTSIYWTFILKLLFPEIIVIWHDHWGFSDSFKNSDRKIIKYFSFLIDGVICVNDKIKEWNSRNLKLSEKSISYIPNFPLLNIVEKKKNKIPILVCLANIRDQKDHPNLIKACFLLKEQNINFKLLLAGSLEDIYWVEKIKKIIYDLNLTENVFFLGPVIDVSDLLSKADVGILSSVSEGLPVSLLEYGLAGLPVVCTDVGQCKEVLGNDNFGWIVPSKSPEKLAAAIKIALQDPELASLKGEKLKKNIDDNYGSKGFMIRYFEFLNKIKI